MLYFKLAGSDVKLANETHAHQGFKFYTFSNLILMNRKTSTSGLYFEKAFFIMASPDTDSSRVLPKVFSSNLNSIWMDQTAEQIS